MRPIRKILVPIDLDLDPSTILELASQMALAFGAELELVHIFETPGYGGPKTLSIKDKEVPEVQSELKHWRTAQTMMNLLKDLERRGILASGRMAFGVAEETLRDLAEQESMDLVVMGTHSREGLDRFVHGSVAGALIRISPCPVLVLPHIRDLEPRLTSSW